MNARIEKIYKLAEDTTIRYKPEELADKGGDALFIGALAEYDRYHGTDKYTPYIKRYYENLRWNKMTPDGEVMAASFGAWLLYKKIGGDKLKKLCSEYASVINKKDITSYQNSFSAIEKLKLKITGRSFLYAIMFCWEYGKEEHDEQLLINGKVACGEYVSLLASSDDALLKQSFYPNVHVRYPISRLYLGVDNAAFSYGLGRSLEHSGIDKDTEFYKRHCAALLKYQRTDGTLAIILNRISAKDMTATAFLPATFLLGVSCGLLGGEFHKAGIRAFNSLTDSLTANQGLLDMPATSAYTLKLPFAAQLGYRLPASQADKCLLAAGALYSAIEYEKLLTKDV